MRALAVCSLCCALLLVVASAKPCRQPSGPDCVEPWLDLSDAGGVDSSWEHYKQRFTKRYNSREEESKRKEIWQNNTLQMMEENMNSSHTYSLLWMSTSDLTKEEFRQTRLGYRKPENISQKWGLPYLGVHRADPEVSAPSYWDWSMAGHSSKHISVVTRVKDQGNCGSCWAFSATGALEGAHAVANGIDAGQISISEQQLMDCMDVPCQQGGNPWDAFDFEKGKNVCSEQSYPYQGVEGQCQSQGCTTILYTTAIGGGYSVAPNEGATYPALMERPLAVCLDASDGDFDNYGSGVLNNCPQGQTDHCVLLVGWGYAPQAFWKIKNSWGTSWGLDGFGLLARGVGGTDACAVLSETTGVYVFGKYNPRSQFYNSNNELVEPLAGDGQMISV